MTARPLSRLLAAVLAVALLASCAFTPGAAQSTTQLLSESITYADHDKQERFKDALKQAGVPHEIYIGYGNMEYVRWKPEDRATVHKIQVSLFGEDPPAGRSINFGAPYDQRFKKWLTENDIPFTTMQSDGKEYVVWEAADYPRVSKWKDFPRETFEKAFNLSSNPTVDTDARKSGTRGSP